MERYQHPQDAARAPEVGLASPLGLDLICGVLKPHSTRRSGLGLLHVPHPPSKSWAPSPQGNPWEVRVRAGSEKPLLSISILTS